MIEQPAKGGALLLRAVGAAILVGLFLQGAGAEPALVPERVSFYFAAHEDDWQLFMNPSAFTDVADARTKTVFIHVTAGDNGAGLGKRGRKYPYYLARENGAEFAIRFMADAGEQPVEMATERLQFVGHAIDRVSYRSTAAYFLRLPDGHPSGSGFPGTGHQSLARLAKGEIGRMSAIDSSAAYGGWKDLVSTVRAIIDYERRQSRSVQLNVPELDARLNPNDHSDHQMTARLALEAAYDLACARRVHYVDYASHALPENLFGAQRDQEVSVVAATAAGLLALDHASIWHPYHRTYLGRNYFRVEEGTGECAAPVAAPQQTVSAKATRPSANR